LDQHKISISVGTAKTFQKPRSFNGLNTGLSTVDCQSGTGRHTIAKARKINSKVFTIEHEHHPIRLNMPVDRICGRHGDPALAENAVWKLEKRTKTPN